MSVALPTGQSEHTPLEEEGYVRRGGVGEGKELLQSNSRSHTPVY
jgi:hypothetical protein